MKTTLTSFLALSAMCTSSLLALDYQWQTKYMTLSVNDKGYIVKMVDKTDSVNYSPEKYQSPIMNLSQGEKYIHPTKASYDATTGKLTLTYENGSVAVVKVNVKDSYIRLELESLAPRNGIDHIVWGPYNTTISQTIGEIISVVRNGKFAIGIMGLDDNTTSGPPCDGEMYQLCYIIHSPDPKKYPLPPNLKEGQRFRIGGDGINDVAFYSHPEEYFRYLSGNGAALEPEFGSSIVMHSRDRSVPKTILYPKFNDFPSVKAPRHLVLEQVDEDYIGSAIAFYGCPDDKGLNVIEQIVKNEGLPYITRDGKWIKDPSTFRTDIAWRGPHDKLLEYALQLNIKGVQDEGLGEYYVNPANRWAGKQVTLNGKKVPISEYTKQLNKHGIAYGLHTLTLFLQPHCSDVAPVPSQDLCTVLTTKLTKAAGPTDTNLQVEEVSFLNEKGAWDDNHTNVLRIGTELITYEGVTTEKPYTLTGVKRGAYRTEATSHWPGEEVAKLQINCYHGFVPNLKLQDQYADYYAKWLIDGGMNYIDFDGFESFTYQGHGQYSFKRFLRQLFDKYHKMGGSYLRVMGSCVFEGNWHYMSVCNVGGGNHMFNPVTNKWGIEGKDIRYAFTGSYFPCTFGIQNFSPTWDVQIIENLQSKAIAWDATYMLGLSQQAVEANPNKDALFKAFRTWEDARIANIFPRELKLEMRKEENRYHLEQQDANTWTLYDVTPDNSFTNPRVLKRPQ